MGVGAMMSSGEVPRTSKADDLWIRPSDDAWEWVNAAAPANARGSSSRVLADGIIVAPMFENETVCLKEARVICVNYCNEMCRKYKFTLGVFSRTVHAVRQVK